MVLEFGQHGNKLEAYMLVANYLTRRIHERYVERKNRAAGGTAAEPKPLVIVIEEAHKFLDPALARFTIFGSIAREMRKYNVTLLVVDQRPSAIDEEVMSQIGTRVTCLLDNEADVQRGALGRLGRGRAARGAGAARHPPAGADPRATRCRCRWWCARAITTPRSTRNWPARRRSRRGCIRSNKYSPIFGSAHYKNSYADCAEYPISRIVPLRFFGHSFCIRAIARSRRNPRTTSLKFLLDQAIAIGLLLWKQIVDTGINNTPCLQRLLMREKNFRKALPVAARAACGSPLGQTEGRRALVVPG